MSLQIGSNRGGPSLKLGCIRRRRPTLMVPKLAKAAQMHLHPVSSANPCGRSPIGFPWQCINIGRKPYDICMLDDEMLACGINSGPFNIVGYGWPIG